jgi:transcriptional regulator of arginine metabolism
MKNRERRQGVIREIISSGRISNQESLLQMLRGKGIVLTQATLSRDLKMMQVVKVPSGQNGYTYVVPEEIVPGSSGERQKANYLAEGFITLNFSGNLGVIRTLPGYASSIASVIDKTDTPSVLGTIAGDDTILVVLKEKESAGELVTAIIGAMPMVKTKIQATGKQELVRMY